MAAVLGLAALFLPLSALATPLDLEAGAVAWERLVFRAASRPNDLSVEVTLSEVPQADLAVLLPDPETPAPDTAVLRMTAAIDVYVTGRTYQTDVWFQSKGLAPLQRRRDKTGKDANRKTFRYLAEGVRRLRIEPAGKAEAALPPEDWSQVQELFFPYGPARAGCPVLSDPNLLFFASGAVRGEPLALCVFNKQTVHGVRISARPGGEIKTDYHEIRGGTRQAVQRRTAVRRIEIRSFEPDANGLGGAFDPEPFEFLEMRGKIEIDLDAASGLPLRVGGDVGGFGRVDFLLSEVTWKP